MYSMIPDTNQIISLWTRLVDGEEVSLLLAVAAVAMAAIVDVLVRVGRARTARRLRIAAAAYAHRQMAKESPLSRSAVLRLSAASVDQAILNY